MQRARLEKQANEQGMNDSGQNVNQACRNALKTDRALLVRNSDSFTLGDLRKARAMARLIRKSMKGDLKILTTSYGAHGTLCPVVLDRL